MTLKFSSKVKTSLKIESVAWSFGCRAFPSRAAGQHHGTSIVGGRKCFAFATEHRWCGATGIFASYADVGEAEEIRRLVAVDRGSPLRFEKLECGILEWTVGCCGHR